MQSRKKLRYIFLIYWFLLTYIVACLIWWFIILYNQNQQMTDLKLQQLHPGTASYHEKVSDIKEAEKRKTAQYIGEGVIFFLLIMAGAIFLFRAVRRQLKISHEQQNFMIAITHELKTPIAIAKLNLETLQKRKLDGVQQLRLIYNSLQEVNRLNSLCNNMLLSSQMEAGGYIVTDEHINMGVLVNNCINDFRNRFPNKNFVSFIDNEAFVKGDHLLLEMAVNNLIDNAIKYTPKETNITITLSKNSNSETVLQVKDEGKGIADIEKDKVFDKFYRVGNAATKSSKGTGLGLYLTKRIVKQHNGNIFLTDNKPSGIVFTITFSLIKN
jgi:two-component system sensor histidine kinase CiaH